MHRSFLILFFSLAPASPSGSLEGVEERAMHNEFTAIIEQDEGWYIAYCPEVPGANGQGRTIEESRQSLAEAIALILDDRR